MINIQFNNVLIIQDIINLSVDNNISLLEASIEYCRVFDLDVEFIGELLAKDDAIRGQLESEANKLNFLKKDKSNA